MKKLALLACLASTALLASGYECRADEHGPPKVAPTRQAKRAANAPTKLATAQDNGATRRGDEVYCRWGAQEMDDDGAKAAEDEDAEPECLIPTPATP